MKKGFSGKHGGGNRSEWLCFWYKTSSLAAICWIVCATAVLASPPEPVVAVHFSELTAALETQRASGSTPAWTGTTGYQWWPTAWHYFVMPDALEEALRSDGTLVVEVSDADIAAGRLLNSDGSPRYPIVISLAAEAVADTEITPLRSYVAAGGTLLLGSSALTRRPDGTSRGDFALASEMGLHQVTPAFQNWYLNRTFTKQGDHRLVSHIPNGTLYWQMPLSADEVPWGTVLNHAQNGPFYAWAVRSADAQLIATGDSGPLLTVKGYGAGRIIYHGAMQPLIGHGGMDAGMYAYGLFRNAIRWAFESANTPMIKLSPWRYPYDAALMVRHDFEDFTNLIGSIEASAQIESLLGIKGDYYFCTGEVRENMHNDAGVIGGLRRAVQNYGATIGSHNGGLKNPVSSAIGRDDYFYWHWGPDEALDVTPAGYYSGFQYAAVSIQNSFQDIEGWLAGTGQNRRFWVSPFFNSTRDNSYALLQNLGVIAVGEQKLSPFPHWTLSTQTSGKRYGHVSIPVSDWFIGSTIVQEIERHNSQTLHASVDAYYNMGTLINFYGHKLSIEPIVVDYMTYSLSKPRLWKANSATIYDWWVARSAVSVSGSVSTVSGATIVRANVNGAVDPETAIEIAIPNWSSGVGRITKVLLNGVAADPTSYRCFGDGIKVKVGTSVTAVEVDYSPRVIRPQANDDVYSTIESQPLGVSAPGVLSNDSSGASKTAVLVSAPTHGTVRLDANGAFTYSPQAGFRGTDAFTYKVNDGTIDSSAAIVTLKVSPAGSLFYDDFVRSGDPALASPWTVAYGAWLVTGGVLQGGNAAALQASAYIATNWTDYSVQADIVAKTGVLGGGLGGRVNPANGAHYAAWIYPETAPGNPAILRLMKFSDWWSYTLMQPQIAIPSVGSKKHTLRLSFQGNQISVSLDGASMATVMDTGIGGRAALTSGGVSADVWAASSPSTMTFANVSVNANTSWNPPMATNDSFSAVAGMPLSISAPGVLANDFAAAGKIISAVLMNPPAHGTLVLNPNGSFVYTAASDFVGTDTFTYKVSDGSLDSNVGTVMLSVTSGGGTFFFDDFTRSTDPGALSPWSAKQGGWTITGGMLQGNSTPGSYGNAYVNGSWTDYSVQAEMAWGARAYGGGLGGRVNSITGARYAAWIYPEATAGNSATLRLIKFTDWSSFSVMQQVTVPGVSSSWHTLRLDFLGNRISAWLDGALVTSAVDSGYGGTAAFTAGGISAELWNAVTSPGIALASVVVSAGATSITPAAAPTATNDSYNVVSGMPFSVMAPGVLANDSGATGKTLTAVLVTPPAHGTLVLYTNGAFTYTATSGFAGSDSFIYRVNDGSLDSSNAVVRLTVTAPALPPSAVSDAYSAAAGVSLSVALPGVLVNDSAAQGKTITAVLVSAPSHGALLLNADGSFTYTPTNDFSGDDSFTYRAYDGTLYSSNAVVTLSVAASGNTGGTLLFDGFTRVADPGALSPWVAKQGSWVVTGGLFQGTSTPSSYANAYVSASWTDCSVEAGLKIGAGAYGGGLGGRVNSTTGAHYGAWIYPETTAGGSAVLRLVKFSDWWSFVIMQQVSIPALGSGWHTLRLDLQGSRISVWLDGSLVTTIVDTGFGGTAALTTGGISVDLWNGVTSPGIALTSVTVRTDSSSPAPVLPIATNDIYTVIAGTPLSIPAPGVLANDFAGSGKTLTAVLVSPPAHGTLVMNVNGSFTYTAASGFTGSDSFIYKVSDGSLESSNAVVTLSVTASSVPPVAFNDSYNVAAGTTLTVTAPGVLANDSAAPGRSLTTLLVSPPARGTLVLNADGSFTYTGASGFVGTDSFIYRASDGSLNSSNAVVTLSVGALFSEDFTRSADPGALSPWVAKQGAWTVSGGVMHGTSGPVSGGNVCVSGAWTNYSVQANIKMGAGVYGGGLGGRVNASTGAHYAAWIYPEAAALRLVKFSDWWSFTTMNQVSIPAVGSGWHTLKLVFQGNAISVWLDGVSVVTTVDNGIGAGAFSNGGISADFWSASSGSGIDLDSVTVSGL